MDEGEDIMTGVIKLLLVDDDQGSGELLTKPNGKPLPGPAYYASVIGKCVNDVGVGGASNIVNDPAAGGNRCDLTGGATLNIKLDLDTLPNASFALPGARTPVTNAFCVRNSSQDKCDPSYATAKLGRDGSTLIVTLQNLKSAKPGEISPKIYSVNFTAADPNGRATLLSLDPKIINKPRSDLSLLSVAAIIVVGIVALSAVFFIGRAIGRRAAFSRRG